MQLPVNTCDIEFRLFSIPGRAGMVLLMISAGVTDKFVIVLSICIAPTNENSALTFKVMNEVSEHPGRKPIKDGLHFGAFV